MVILWDHAKVVVHNFICRNHKIHATIEVLPIRLTWLFSFIYASTNKVIRDQMWKNIENISDNYNGAWLIGGDFADVLKANNKLGGRPISHRRSAQIWTSINYCKLIDLGFKGCKYTWFNHRLSNNSLIMECVDKVFGNKWWIQIFPHTSIIHLPKTHSEHNPLLVILIPKQSPQYPKPFRLEPIWCGHPHFHNVVASHWSNNSFTMATPIFRDKVLA